MRVGLSYSSLCRNGRIDGLGHYTAELAVALKRAGVEPVGFTAATEQLSLDHRVTGLPSYPTGRSGLKALVYSHLGLKGLPGRCTNRIDIYHATDHRIPRLRGIPTVATLFDAIPFSHPHWANPRLRGLKNRILRRSARWADRVICASDAVAEEVSHYWNVSHERISVIPLGVDIGRLSIPAKLPASLERLTLKSAGYLLFIGTTQPRKNLETLIRGYQLLPTATREEFPLVVVGAHANPQQIEQLIPPNLHSQVILTGHLSDADVTAYLQWATMLIVPSLHEGFGLPVLEGFAARTPVICSRAAALPEVAGDAALLFDPLDEQQLAAHIRYLLQDEHACIELTERGLLRAQNYSWQSTAEQTIALYRTLL